jgi:hypothetical protein
MVEDTLDSLLRCHRCDAPCDDGDNFCRHCGAGLNGSRLPAVRDSYEVVPWRASVPALVRGVAVVAAGTLDFVDGVGVGDDRNPLAELRTQHPCTRRVIGVAVAVNDGPQRLVGGQAPNLPAELARRIGRDGIHHDHTLGRHHHETVVRLPAELIHAVSDPRGLELRTLGA